MKKLSFEKGEFLPLFLIKKKITFQRSKERDYKLTDYKILLTGKKKGQLDFELEEDYKIVYCRNLNIEAEKLKQLIGEDTGEFEVFVL